jgi:di/tricarboxylate transporter
MAGLSLVGSHIGERYGLTVLMIERPDKTIAAPDPNCPINGGDTLVILGREDRVMQLAQRGIEIKPASTFTEPSRALDLTEIAVLPRATIIGQSLVDLCFRAQYGLSAIALLREGKVLRTDVGTRPLEAGDALLVMGPPAKIQAFASAQEDFMIVEGSHATRPARPHKARMALLILALMIAGVVFDLVPTAFAALAAAVAMIATRCLNLETAYQSVELRVIFLIAGMSSISIAMTRTDLAAQLGGFVVDAAGPLGSFAVLAVAFMMTMAVTQMVTGQVAALIMAPIVLSIALQTGIDPRAMGIVAATACSTAFLTPMAHPVNVLMMGPGGYRSADFLRVGLGLTLVVFVTLMAGMAVFWGGSL